MVRLQTPQLKGMSTTLKSRNTTHSSNYLILEVLSCFRFKFEKIHISSFKCTVVPLSFWTLHECSLFSIKWFSISWNRLALMSLWEAGKCLWVAAQRTWQPMSLDSFLCSMAKSQTCSSPNLSELSPSSPLQMIRSVFYLFQSRDFGLLSFSAHFNGFSPPPGCPVSVRWGPDHQRNQCAHLQRWA